VMKAVRFFRLRSIVVTALDYGSSGRDIT